MFVLMDAMFQHGPGVTPRFPNNVNDTSNQSIQRKTECHTTFKT